MDPQIPLSPHRKKGKFRETVESLLTALLAAFLIRSFVVEPFKIPSGSMIPTLMVGDHIFVNKFIYGLRIPFTKTKIIHFKTPQRGDPIVFIFPIDESKDFIKRVIGLPGDRIRLEGDEVLVNDQRLAHHEITLAPRSQETSDLLPIVRDAAASELGVSGIPYFPGWQDYRYYAETIDGKNHWVQFDLAPNLENREIVVPEGHLFVMGDNRDNSADSREWGFVPLENIKGKAMFVWLSLDFERKTLRWERFGKWIH